MPATRLRAGGANGGETCLRDGPLPAAALATVPVGGDAGGEPGSGISMALESGAEMVARALAAALLTAGSALRALAARVGVVGTLGFDGDVRPDAEAAVAPWRTGSGCVRSGRAAESRADALR